MNARDLNVQSNLIFIIGGLKEHQKQSYIPLNKYGIIHILRQIDDFKEYPPTFEIKQLCKELGIKDSIWDKLNWTAENRKKVNKELKIKNHSDTVQIEHLNGGVKGLVEKLISVNWSDNLEENLIMIRKILDVSSKCCYKLKVANKDINAQTDFDNVKFN